MISLYEKDDANFPRLETDRFFVNFNNTLNFGGHIDDCAKFVQGFLLDKTVWKRFVDQFRFEQDGKGGWRGEFWGKMMRGACFTYSLTKCEELYKVLEESVRDMLTVQKGGRISSYNTDAEFHGWDLWSRKYVLLGMQYFLEICKCDELKAEIIDSMKGQVDYIIEFLGDGKTPITSTSEFWRGLNSSSILEPIVRLYNVTGEVRYLEFARHIVSLGGMDSFNAVDMALEDKLFPYQYPITKAYEMISFFEGVLEYFRATKEEKYKQAVIRFADKLIESDVTIIGCCGCTHELFDHSAVRQTNTTNGELAQETCVTVTLMKFMYQLTLLTGEAKYVEVFERAFYNAYLGAVNTEKIVDDRVKKDHPNLEFAPLPFDSYSPLVADIRGKQIGGFMIMPDGHYYGCCACIGSAGIGLYGKMAVLTSKDGVAINLYNEGSIKTTTPSDNPLVLKFNTEYPKDNTVKICLGLQKDEEFEIKLRIPYWSEESKISVCGDAVKAESGYVSITRAWKSGDVIEMEFDMRVRAVYPKKYAPELLFNRGEFHYLLPNLDIQDPLALKHIAITRGPLVMAAENRLGYSVDDAVSIKVGPDNTISAEIPEIKKAPYKNIIEVAVPLQSGEMMHLTDYASAGKLWNEQSKMAAWIKTK